MSRKPIIAGNWKLNLTVDEGVALVQALAAPAAASKAQVVVCPTALAVHAVAKVAAGTAIAVGGQNIHWEEKGAFTGEISVAMLAKLDVVYVIVGHSERRELFGETDEDVRRKLEAVIAGGMTPIVCVGETLEEREAGAADAKVTGQVEAALTGLAEEHVSGLVIAYEPIWAIGTGRTATPDDAQGMIGTIRKVAAGICGDEVAGRIRIQYGGSVKASNIAELMAQPDIDGALVGGASLDPDEFARIVQYRLGG